MGYVFLGGIVLWLQHRNPQTLDSGIDDFHREMKALAPPETDDDKPSRAARPQRRGPES